MDNQSKDRIDNDVFVLYPVFIPGWVTPVRPASSADGGIPKSIYDDKPSGLECVIDPWAEFNSWVLAEDDRVDLFLDGRPTPVDGKTIGPGEENERVRLYVPKRLLHEGVNEIFYKVTRLGQIPETSRILKVLYHSLAPGEPGHSERKLQLPADVVANGVDSSRAEQGVLAGFDYPNRRAYDFIRLHVGTVYIDREVLPGESVPGSPVVTKTLYTDTFERAGDNPRTLFFYGVTDQLGNLSGPSATSEVNVHLKDTPVPIDLRPPKLLELREGQTELDIARDFYDADYATVEVAFTGSARGQTVRVYWIGRNNTYGSEIQSITYSGQTLRFQIHRLYVLDCIGSGVEVNYTVRLPGSTVDLPSRPLKLTVARQKHHLPAPTLSGDKRTATAYYPALDGAYTVRIAWFGKYKRYGAEVSITHPSETKLPIDPLWIAESAGLPVMINYTIKKTGASEPLIFSWVLRIQL